MIKEQLTWEISQFNILGEFSEIENNDAVCVIVFLRRFWTLDSQKCYLKPAIQPRQCRNSLCSVEFLFPRQHPGGDRVLSGRPRQMYVMVKRTSVVPLS